MKVTETVEESRGPVLDYLFGPRKRSVERISRGPGMRAQTLQTYLDLMQEHFKKQERQRKKGKMRRQKKSKISGF